MKAAATVLAALVLAFSLPSPAQAVGVPFGGIISVSMPCSCSGNWLVIVAGFPSGYVPLVVQPGVTIPFPFYSLYKPGAFTKGDYVPGGVCLMPGTPCWTFPVLGTINLVGTSP